MTIEMITANTEQLTKKDSVDHSRSLSRSLTRRLEDLHRLGQRPASVRHDVVEEATDRFGLLLDVNSDHFPWQAIELLEDGAEAGDDLVDAIRRAVQDTFHASAQHVETFLDLSLSLNVLWIVRRARQSTRTRDRDLVEGVGDVGDVAHVRAVLIDAGLTRSEGSVEIVEVDAEVLAGELDTAGDDVENSSVPGSQTRPSPGYTSVPPRIHCT